MRHSWPYFAVWFLAVVFVSTLLFLLLSATRLGPGESAYNNGLGNLYSLPFLAFCFVALLILAVFYPRKFHSPVAIIVLAVYFSIATFVWSHPVIYGAYALTLRIIDRSGNPAPNVRVDFLQQRWLAPGGILIAVFFPQDSAATSYSDKDGLVSTHANIYTRLLGTVNRAPHEVKPLNPDFKSAEFSITDQYPDPTYEVDWSQQGELNKDNSKHWSKTIRVPPIDVLTVYLAAKDDQGSYPMNTTTNPFPR